MVGPPSVYPVLEEPPKVLYQVNGVAFGGPLYRGNSAGGQKARHGSAFAASSIVLQFVFGQANKLQDNATCHKSAVVTRFLAAFRVTTLEWPPKSHDIKRLT